MAQLETFVKKYRALAQIPTIVGGRIMHEGKVINAVWTRRNLELGKPTKSFVSYNLNSDLSASTQSIALDVTNELISQISPTGKYRAVVRECDTKDGSKQFLEVWENVLLRNCVDLTAADVHLDVYADGEFGSLKWSPSETQLIYIAEKKIAKSEPFYKRNAKKDKDDVVKGQEYIYRQDWGEQLVNKKQSVIAMFDISEDSVKILEGLPDNVCPAQVIWGLDGKQIFGIAYKTDPRKLGLIYCSNRLSSIFSLNLEGQYVEIKLQNKSVKCPTLSADGKVLIWLQRDAGGPHCSTMTLVKTILPISETSSVKTVVDLVQSEKEIKNKRIFYGLYNSKFPKRCWANDGRLLLSTPQRNTVNSYAIDINTGDITELPVFNGSLILLDVKDDLILACKTSFFVPDTLVAAKLPPQGSESAIEWKNVSSVNAVEGLENYVCEYLDLQQNTGEDVTKFTAIYLGPKSAPAKSVPLVIRPHGGPHSAVADAYSLELSLFLQTGHAQLLVNYRGSIGAGEKSVHFLLGRIGDTDVSDCILATKEAIKKYECIDENKLILCGGSHGGFLVTHLSGQYPDMFKAVIARNPVTDVATMSVISDIPDWCYVEAGAEYSQVGEVNDEILLKMRKASPIEHVHKVKAPTLLQVGSKDLRVPPPQSIEYYHRLKANNIIVQMNMYEDNHPLGLVPNEMDQLINTLLWISKHV